MLTMRSMVSTALLVWTVANTRWPVSAACIATFIVSTSRISPMRITSGDCRTTYFSASVNESVSSPTSRWLTMAILSWWTYSMGSSMVTMLHLRVQLMWSIIAASVVDFPHPVGPVIRMNPWRSSAICLSMGGSSRSSTVLILMGMIRMTSPMLPRSM